MTANDNDQSERIRWEKAVGPYIHTIIPSQRLIRAKVMKAYRRSNEKFRELYRKLAK